MRLLHTSDWHLGASIKHLDCEPEQRRFLDWLAGTLDERAIDVLVVAGDIFHYASPANAARKLYFDFLSRCGDIDSLRKVVCVAGNHDSPTGIDAPSSLLSNLDVHVVGGLPRRKDEWSDCLVPVEGDDGEVETVIAAVPYVQEARLGISLGDGGEAELQQHYRQAFRELYSELADRADERWPEANLVATGHLTVYGEDEEPESGDFHTGIHRIRQPAEGSSSGDGEPTQTRRVGAIDAMPPSIFDERFDYVALGHIHRPMPVGGRRHIRYSGTPVPMTFEEDTPPRRVIQVDLGAEDDDGTIPIEMIEVPKSREVLQLVERTDQIFDRLRNLRSDAVLPPAVFVKILLGADETPGQDRRSRLTDIVDDHEAGDAMAPILVEVREEFAAGPRDDTTDDEERLPPIEEMTAEEVFRKLYRRKYPDRDEPPPGLIAKFQTVEQEYRDKDKGDA